MERCLNRPPAVAAWLLLGLLTTFCNGRPVESRPVVAVSVLPQAYFVDRVAEGLVRVEVMIPPGASPTTHEPTLAQRKALAEAVLYVRIGHPHFSFEQAWLDRLLTDRSELAVVDSCAGLEGIGDDPHVWLVPRFVRSMVLRIAAALTSRFPEHTAQLAANRDRLLEEIDAVDADVRRALAGKQGGVFLVVHPAWGSFALEYGLEQLALHSERKEPTPKRLATLIARARTLGIDTVFAQPQFDRAIAEVVAGEIGGRVELLDPFAYEWSATLRSTALRLARAVRR